MKKTCLIIICLSLLTSLRAAETPSPAAATPAQPPLPSPALVELAHKVILATKMDRMFDQMGAQMQQIAAQQMNLSAPNVSPAQKEAALKYMGEVMKLSIDSTKSLLADADLIFADVYSETELKAMLAFYQSAEGQSILQKQPQIMQHLMPLIQDMQKELRPKIKQIAEKAKAEAAAAPAPAATPAVAPANAKVQ